MTKLLSALVAIALAVWGGWIMIASDEAVRVERAAAVCGGTAKVIGSFVRMFDESTGESFFNLHTSWSASCQASVWYFFTGADEQRITTGTLLAPSQGPGAPGATAAASPAGALPPQRPPEPAHTSGSGVPTGDERL